MNRLTKQAKAIALHKKAAAPRSGQRSYRPDCRETHRATLCSARALMAAYTLLAMLKTKIEVLYFTVFINTNKTVFPITYSSVLQITYLFFPVFRQPTFLLNVLSIYFLFLSPFFLIFISFFMEFSFI